MSQVTIREYADIKSTYGKQAQCVSEPGEAENPVTASGSSTQSAAFGANTQLIALSAPPTQAIAYLVGLNPTALSTSLRLPASGFIYLGVTPGHKIAVIEVA